MAVDPRKVLPTKINLIRLRRELAMLKRIRRVMEEKREVLLHYIMGAAGEYVRYQEEVYKELMKVYEDYYVGAASEGLDRVRSYVDATEWEARVEVGTRVLFAVKTPTFKIAVGEPPRLLPPGSDPRLVESFEEMRNLMGKILKLAEYEEMLNRLIDELRETQRLINALDYVILPSYQQAIKYIKLTLEERMREDFIRLKMIKRKLEERAA